jgi:sulfatase maturation enzyme AslB (radical SAM superfamily)
VNRQLDTTDLDTKAAKERCGYIQPHILEELWFHTGTVCNLGCSFCLEGSGPDVHRLETISAADVAPLMDEALSLGVQRFSFTGGEPFMNKDMVPILRMTLEHRPTLVLTNGTRPIRNRLNDLRELKQYPNEMKFRVSLDHPDPERHDRARGVGSFDQALQTLAQLHEIGFAVSVARHTDQSEDGAAVDAAFREHFREINLPENINIVSFPELHPPNSRVDVPTITENCMTTYKDESERSDFMCAFSKMVIKIDGRMHVYACTLVDDDARFDLGTSLNKSMDKRILLHHHRCFSCFSQGTSCAER